MDQSRAKQNRMKTEEGGEADNKTKPGPNKLQLAFWLMNSTLFFLLPPLYLQLFYVCSSYPNLFVPSTLKLDYDGIEGR